MVKSFDYEAREKWKAVLQNKWLERQEEVVGCSEGVLCEPGAYLRKSSLHYVATESKLNRFQAKIKRTLYTFCSITFIGFPDTLMISNLHCTSRFLWILVRVLHSSQWLIWPTAEVGIPRLLYYCRTKLCPLNCPFLVYLRPSLAHLHRTLTFRRSMFPAHPS